MEVLFTIVMVLCAREDSRDRSVSLFTLTALVAVAAVVAITSAEATSRLTAALILALPFTLFTRQGRGGTADIPGVLAVGLRFPLERALAALMAAVLIGAVLYGRLDRQNELRLDGHQPDGQRWTGERLPFFPLLAAGTVLAGGLG